MKCYIYKTRNLLLIQAIMIALLLVPAGFSYGSDIKILSPQDGEEVGAAVFVSGTSDIKDGSHIAVFIRDKSIDGKWYPQHQAKVDEKGNWQTMCFTGTPNHVGKDFEIAVTTVDEAVKTNLSQYIRNVRENARSDAKFQPISLPKTRSQIQTVIVRKVSNDTPWKKNKLKR